MKSGRTFQMKLSFVVTVVATAALVVYAQQAMPRMSTVEPGNGKAGDVITANGENLQKEAVARVYLTDGKNDTEVQIVEQTPTAIKFKIPAKVAAGRLALMVLTAGKDAKLMEQPVKVQIDE
jgi:IPT/TIG domain